MILLLIFLSSLKASTSHVLLSYLRANRCLFLCNAIQHLGLKLSHTPPRLHTGIFTKVCSCLQYFWKPNNLFFILFSSSAVTFVLDQMELFSPLVIFFFLQHLQECRDEHRVPGSDTDRSHTAPRELPKCYKDEPYGQPKHLRPLIGIFKQPWLMGQLLQVWDQWKCNLIFWTQLLNFLFLFLQRIP